MRPPSGFEDIDLIMAAVAMRKALVEHCHAYAPKRVEIEALRDAVLTVCDAEIEELHPKPRLQDWATQDH